MIVRLMVLAFGAALLAPTPAPTATPLQVAAPTWEVQMPPSFYWASRTVVISDNLVIIASSGGILALDAATGDQRWRIYESAWQSIVTNGVLYEAGPDGSLIARAVKDGAELWRTRASCAPNEHPLELLRDGDRLAMACSGSKIVVIDMNRHALSTSRTFAAKYLRFDIVAPCMYWVNDQSLVECRSLHSMVLPRFRGHIVCLKKAQVSHEKAVL